jgi:hypothetical protein
MCEPITEFRLSLRSSANADPLSGWWHNAGVDCITEVLRIPIFRRLAYWDNETSAIRPTHTHSHILCSFSHISFSFMCPSSSFYPYFPSLPHSCTTTTFVSLSYPSYPLPPYDVLLWKEFKVKLLTWWHSDAWAFDDEKRIALWPS